MTPNEFIAKWRNQKRKERSAAQSHFIDLCRLLDEPSPADADPDGNDYDFEYGARKTTGGRGFADVFKRGHFGWEYKGPHGNLDTAFAQLQRYAVALDNPPLLIVSDIGTTIRLHTNWTNTVSRVHEIPIERIGEPEMRHILKAAFSDPEALRPTKTRQELTQEVATDFARLAQSLRDRKHPADRVAHFVNRLIFCMFAEDVKLLPDAMFTRMLDRAAKDPDEFERYARLLFAAMRTGGDVGFEKVSWFNGGLFDDDLVFGLTKAEIAVVRRAADQYWGDIDPSILGTLFERGLDPDKRSQLGAHYTDREKIMRIIEPVVIAPLTREWDTAKAEIEASYVSAASARKRVPTTQAEAKKVYASARRQEEAARRAAVATFERFVVRLRNFRILDPACGSGNFLFLALKALKDVEHRAILDMEILSSSYDFPHPSPAPSTGPENVLGLEINHFAAELARVSVWIGEIQWMLRHGFTPSRDPILKSLRTIECRDALVSKTDAGDFEEAIWPEADAIIGNPPFLGDRLMIGRLGLDASERIRSIYAGRVPRSANLVCYWIEKAARAIADNRTHDFGLVTTNAVRGGSNRKVVADAMNVASLVMACADEPWVVDGAAVRVSMICFSKAPTDTPTLDGRIVSTINSDLTSKDTDVTEAVRLGVNAGVCVHGSKKIGSFDIDGDTARGMLRAPLNPNGLPNSTVLTPTWNGADVVGRPGDRWLVDFGMTMNEDEASLFEQPFRHVVTHVKPERLANRNPVLVRKWWLHGGPRPAMRNVLPSLTRCIATPAVAKHRIFVFVPKGVLPDAQLMVVLRDDDTTFGILHSRFHELWALRTSTRMGVGNDPRYTPTTTFDTFPFPEGLTPDIAASAYEQDPRARSIAGAAARLDELRRRWLHPPDVVCVEPEVVGGYPDRLLPKDAAAEAVLRNRTLTKLYNERPVWLANAHVALDAAVSAAYGWPSDLSDDEVLSRLFALNRSRANSNCHVDSTV